MQVDFHSGMDDKLGYACRLLRKAVGRGSRVQVRGEAGEVDALDQALWTFDPHEFIPHLRWHRDGSPPQAMHRTPVWLLAYGMQWPASVARPEVLLNLGPQPLETVQGGQGDEGVELAGRIIELVGADPAEVESGRRRWRQYVERGVQPVHHAVGREQA
jgi:DNA polymerase-3 subunit chi